MMYLSTVRMGIANGLITLKKPVNIHSLMVHVQPGMTEQFAGRKLTEDDYGTVRAQFIRSELPELLRQD